MKIKHGNKPWTTHSKHDTYGDMEMEQDQRESIATTLLDLEDLFLFKKVTQPIISQVCIELGGRR